MCIRDSGKIVENGVSKSDTLSSSDNENIRGVEVSSDGVLVSVIELKREYEESFSGYQGQRVNFSHVGEVKASRVFLGGRGCLQSVFGTQKVYK